MAATRLSGGQVVKPEIAQIWDWLDAVPDPEIPVISLVDLGIIRDVTWEGDMLNVTVTPTYSGCPATTQINEDILAGLAANGLTNVTLKRQLSPAWTTDWLTEKGAASLEKFGIAPPAKGVPARCPNCHGTDLEKSSQFGSTPCKALWKCRSCLEPFDYFKCI
ncbi:1,2-phenylacetyl-CoA epoxidase subunit PaaD [Aliiroseovarius subalbicans]|uniref:1,2-phenylacetyl-CoA epoxidase subunit PaaD n=1 Tax=Aliiroseovarius subalbicans TaxID=2925840 RepID=UPI001F5934CA|nr:1,2-phenylacetyl-CoA epoxidase subunit PaaD [Aliiroseovarius subalbicans]MCI2399259.1 phenylacetate-CoA oxygenase subunit PaaJ [Aliiroseovarius subalbicans]